MPANSGFSDKNYVLPLANPDKCCYYIGGPVLKHFRIFNKKGV
jgi:hypothetical protein